mmetsp:Transcript_39933/g.89610  ORF Transcript_39933/g.89610 Transcript_39933/m.89610 type:complete len:221 (+) Transcript_39933:1147-1809(+)
MAQFAASSLERMSGFNTRSIVHMLDGFALAGVFDHAFFNEALQELVRRNEPDSVSRSNQLSRVMFCLALEFPDFVQRASRPVQVLLEQNQKPFQGNEGSEHLELLREALEELSLNVAMGASKGPYVFNARVFYTGSFGRRRLGLDLICDAQICPLTRVPLGATRLKRRHARAMGWDTVVLRRRDWVKLNSSNRVVALRQALVAHVSRRSGVLEELREGSH